MTFQQLQYVLEVYKAGSVSQAAKNLFVGQSSVSISIGNLEKELGYTIFNRSKSGATPTRRGKDVIEHAARICESYRLITGPDKSAVTHVRINAGSFSASRRAAKRLLEENRENREVAFSVLGLGMARMQEQLALFELDLGVCFVFAPRMHTVEATFKRKGLQWREMAEFPAAVYLGPGHRLYDAPEVTLRDLEQEWLIDTAEGGMSTSPFFNSVMSLRPDRVLRISSPRLREELLETGVGYVVKPSTQEQENNRRKIPLENVRFKLVMLYNPLRPMRPEVQRFVELLEEELNKCTPLELPKRS